MKTTLLIMAAGIGSRFGTGIKQLEPVDDANHSRLGRESQSDFSCLRTLFWASSYTSSSARTPMTIIIIDVSVRRS